MKNKVSNRQIATVIIKLILTQIIYRDRKLITNRNKLFSQLSVLLNKDIHFNSWRIGKSGSISINRITLQDSNYFMVIKNVSVRLSFWLLISKKVISAIEIQNIVIYKKGGGIPPFSSEKNYTGRRKVEEIFRKYYNIFSKNLKKTTKIFHDSGRLTINQIYFFGFDRKRIVTISNFGWDNNDINIFLELTMSVQANLQLTVKLVPKDFEYLIFLKKIHIKSVPKLADGIPDFSINMKELTCKITQSTIGGFRMSIVNDGLCDFQIINLVENLTLINKIRSEVCVVWDSELSITKNTKITINHIDIHIQLLFFSPDLFKIKIKAPSIYLPSLLDIFKEFKYKKTYQNCLTEELCDIELNLAFSIEDLNKVLLEILFHKNAFKAHPQYIQWPDIRLPFSHVIYKDFEIFKTIMVGPQNPSFIPFEKLPSLLINVFIFTEDPNFYNHSGIDESSLGRALIKNLSSGKVIRGGSTITMQLARNLFLSHEQTMFRKLEEILISGILEEVLLVSKNRILEIYFNIIQFSESIYGIYDASAFYFDKKAADLSIIEGIVLSYIIPRPKFFLDAYLTETIQLKKNLKTHILIVASYLDRRGLTTFKVSEIIKMPIVIKGKQLRLFL